MHDAIDVKQLRDDLDWKQDRLAAYLGVNRSTVSRLESGATPSGPVVKLLRKLIPRAAAKRAAAASTQRTEAAA